MAIVAGSLIFRPNRCVRIGAARNTHLLAAFVRTAPMDDLSLVDQRRNACMLLNQKRQLQPSKYHTNQLSEGCFKVSTRSFSS
jgi:hypothetical protein